jgi:cell division protein ZapA
MPATPVDLVIAGTRYRVVSSASREELQRLAALVDEKLGGLVPPDKPVTPQAMLLAAMAFAHDAERARAAAATTTERAKTVLCGLLGRVDVTLGEVDQLVRKLESPDEASGGDALELTVDPKS